MNISKLRNIAWAIFALMLTATTVMGQGCRNGNRSNYNSNGNCISSISALSEKQKKQILEVEIKHNGVMAELRTKRQATTNAIEKSEIKTDMLKKVKAHRNSVKEVLNEEQQRQYEHMHANGKWAHSQRFANGCENRNFQGRGNGNQQFARGKVCSSNVNNGGRVGDFQNGNANRANYANRGNGFKGQNANYVRGNKRFNNRTNCVGHGSPNVDTCGFKVIEEKEFEQ